MTDRPDCIVHWQDIQESEPGCYPGSRETLTYDAPLGRHFGFKRIGIHHERLLPGHRSCWPHAEATEDEFVMVLEGTPDVWLDGVLHRLGPGDCVGLPAGTGIAHTFLNNSSTEVRLLCVGDHARADNRVHYPMHPAHNRAIGARHWQDCPGRLAGTHDGLPDAQQHPENKRPGRT